MKHYSKRENFIDADLALLILKAIDFENIRVNDFEVNPYIRIIESDYELEGAYLVDKYVLQK